MRHSSNTYDLQYFNHNKSGVSPIGLTYNTSVLLGCRNAPPLLYTSPKMRHSGNVSYSDKLKNPKWQRKRLEILNRDKFTCTKCGDKETELHIHHLKYSGEPWDAPNENLQTLCKYCHFILENFKELDIGLNLKSIYYGKDYRIAVCDKYIHYYKIKNKDSIEWVTFFHKESPLLKALYKLSIK